VRARVVLDEVELVPLREGDRRLGQLRRTFVLVGVEVTPHRERHAIDRVATERRGDALGGVHSSANVISLMP
jgi:hypothetical protein